MQQYTKHKIGNHLNGRNAIYVLYRNKRTLSYLSRFLQTGRIEINSVQRVLDVNVCLETIFEQFSSVRDPVVQFLSFIQLYNILYLATTFQLNSMVMVIHFNYYGPPQNDSRLTYEVTEDPCSQVVSQQTCSCTIMLPCLIFGAWYIDQASNFTLFIENLRAVHLLNFLLLWK